MGGGGVKISPNLDRFASTGENIDCSDFFSDYATFKPNFYVCWSLPLIVHSTSKNVLVCMMSKTTCLINAMI